VTDESEPGTKSVLRSNTANRDVEWLTGKQDFRATKHMLERAILLELTNFVGRVLLLGFRGLSGLLRPENLGEQEKC
jgi:hypothetical protein